MPRPQPIGQPAAPTTTGAGLGTFAGVFTPSILTILGIILFLRLGYVVGGSGLQQALLVIVMANAISLTTSLSVAAISTNLRVKGGGDYYVISRTLGLGFGGAIGLVLFLAQSISVGFYVVGFAEATAALLQRPDSITVRALAGGAVLALFVLAWLGADWATRFQYAVMAAIAAALTAFVAGAVGAWDTEQLAANWRGPADGLPLWVAFAIFFPAVTGFTQGVSMSGDLAQPAKSIPRGVLTAVFASILVYLAVAVLFAAARPNAFLQADYLAMRQIAAFGPLIDAGIVAATLSSALASFLAAPRILQSLARDEIFPLLNGFAAGEGPGDNPRRAVLLTAAIALGVVALGDLNLVASVVSMFFLISYGLLNYATYFEASAASPSFRPTFRFYHPRLGLAGALACLGAMLAIDVAAGIAAAAILFGIYQYLELRAAPVRWADSRRSHHLHETRQHLLAAAAEPEHARDWRPQLLVFSDSPRRRHRLLKFAAWVEGGSGLTTVVRVLVGHGAEMVERREEALTQLRTEIEASEVTAFPLVVIGENLDQTISAVVQSAGIGPLGANTVMANWIDGGSLMATGLGARRFGQNLRTAFALGCNLLVLDADTREWETLDQVEAKARRIDIWWRANRTGELMLLLGHLVTRADGWEEAALRVLADREETETDDDAEKRLRAALEEYRIDADVVIGPMSAKEIVRQSADSSLVFLPFSIHGGRFYGPAGGEIMEYLERLPIVVLTLAAQDVDLAADVDAEAEPDAEPPDDVRAGKASAPDDEARPT